mgnify:CR=1 FL=1
MQIGSLLLKLKDRVLGVPFSKMRRDRQISSSHCGPAVLSTLFSFLDVYVSQRKITNSLRVKNKIKKYGVTVPELAKAAKIYGKKNDLLFWKKSKSTISNLDLIVNKYGYPVGVEWQGVFYEDEDEDNGHYSVVTAINKKLGSIRLFDPYYKFADTDRKFKIKDFVRRWWDTNLIKGRTIRDERMMFVITPNGVDFPKKLGMIKG